MVLKMSHEPEGEMVEQARRTICRRKANACKKRQMLQKTQMLQKQKLNSEARQLPIAAEEVEKVDEATYPSDFKKGSPVATKNW